MAGMTLRRYAAGLISTRTSASTSSTGQRDSLAGALRSPKTCGRTIDLDLIDWPATAFATRAEAHAAFKLTLRLLRRGSSEMTVHR
jgi:hypothetical protein